MANLARSALGATATASSVTGGPTENNPANAIDDNGGTYVLVPHGSNPGSSWLQVDLQTQQYVAGFRLTFVNSVWTPGQYRIESSQDGVVWASRYYRADTASTGADTGQINLFQPATCRYWRVRQLSIPGGTTGMGPLAFELHNVADGADPGDDPEDVAPGGWTMGGTNHALTSAGASATSNRSNHQGTVPDNAIDGNAGTYYLAVKSTDDTWIRVDLGQARGIAGWAISWVNSSWYAAGYVIEYSTDDSEWTVVHTASGQTDAGVPATAFAGGGGATARYWRIRSSNMPGEGMGPTTFALCEGTPPGEPPPPAPKWVNTVSKYHNFESETVTYSLPDEVQDGDLLVFAIATQPAVSYYDMHNATAVAQGWTRLFVDGAGHALLALYKVWHTGDATSLSFTGYGYPLYGHTALTIFRRVHQTEPLAGWTRNEYTTGNPASTTAFDPADWSGDADALLAVLWATAGSRPRTMTTPPADTILHAQHNSATFGSLQVTTKLHSDKADAPAQTATFSAAQEAHQLAVLVRPQDNAGVTHEAAASVSAVATPDAELVQGTIGEAALEAVATVAADGVREKPGEAAAEAAATASAVGSITLGGISDLTEATAEITEANGIVGIGGKANVDAIVVATMNGGYELWADAAPEALAEAEADLLAALAGEADLAATATTSEPVGYMSVAGAADRNAFAVVVALASLVLNGAAEAEALAAFDPEPEASVTKPGAAWRFAVASAFGFGGKVLIGQKTLVARAEVQASGFTGPGGEAAVTASATIDNALPVLADVGATDPIDVPTASATVAPATPDLTLGGIAALEAVAEFGEIPGTIVFEGTSSRFAVASSAGFGGYLVELSGSCEVAATVNEPALIQATPGSADLAVAATVSEPEGILEKWGAADLVATAETAFLQGNVIYGAATDLIAEATFPDTFGGLLVLGHISALAQVFRSARGGFLNEAAGDVVATAAATVSGLGLTAGQAHAVLEAHLLAAGDSLSGGHSNVTARATAGANGAMVTPAAGTGQAQVATTAVGQRRPGGAAVVTATATISDFSGSILLGGGQLQARGTVAGTGSRDRQAQSSVIARVTTSKPTGIATRAAAASVTAQATMPPAIGIPGSAAEPAAPVVTTGALGGIWHQGWCYPMAVSTAALGTTTVIRNGHAQGTGTGAIAVLAVAWPRSGFGTAEATAQLTGHLRKPAAAQLDAAITVAAEAIKLVPGSGQPQTVRATTAAEGVRERFGAAGLAARATFQGFGGVQGRADLLLSATATGSAFSSRDNVEGEPEIVNLAATAEALGGIWRQGLGYPMAVSTVASAQVSMIWGARALPELRAAVAAALARQHQAQADNRAEVKHHARSRVARTGGGTADVQAATAANGVGLVEATAPPLAAPATVTANPVRIRTLQANVTGRLTIDKRLGGLVHETGGATEASVAITRDNGILRRLGNALVNGRATTGAVAVVAPSGASHAVARATVLARPGRVVLSSGQCLARADVGGLALRQKPGEGAALGWALATAALAEADRGESQATATASVAALGGVRRQALVSAMAGAISAGTARRDVTDTVTAPARATLTGWAFRRLLAEASGHAQVTMGGRAADSLAAAGHAQVTMGGNAGRLLRSGSQQLQARARSLAFAIYAGESAIVLSVTATANGAREQASSGAAEVGATVEGQAGLRHLGSGDLAASVGLSQPEHVNSRLGAATLLVGATAHGFLGRLMERTGAGAARATITRAVLARTRLGAADLAASAAVTGKIGRAVEVEAQALAEVRVTGSEGREIQAGGHIPVFAGVAGTVGRIVAGRSTTARAGVTASGSGIKDRQGLAAVTAGAQLAATAGLLLSAGGDLAAGAELAGELAPVVKSGFCGASSFVQASASGGHAQAGRAQVIARATVTAKLARMALGNAKVVAVGQVRGGAGREHAAEGSVTVGVTATAGLAQSLTVEAQVTVEAGTLALGGLVLQGWATAMQTAGAHAHQAGALRALAGALTARAWAVAVIAGQAPAVAEIVARASATGAGSSGLPWWGGGTVPTPPSDGRVTVTSGGDPGSKLKPSSPFG